MPNIKEKNNPHIYYHPFCNHMNKAVGEDWKGIEAIEAAEKYAETHEEIKVVGVDDRLFSGSVLVLIPHPNMGITAHVIPQLTNDTSNFFMYPNHSKELIEAVIELRAKYNCDKVGH